MFLERQHQNDLDVCFEIMYRVSRNIAVLLKVSALFVTVSSSLVLEEWDGSKTPHFYEK